MRAFRHYALSALLFSSAGSAEPLQPTGKWEVQYSDVACTAKRQFGDYVLAFQPSPLGTTVRYVVEGSGRADAGHQFETDVSIADGGAPIKTTSLVYPLHEKGRRGMQLILTKAQSDRLQSARRFMISSDLLVARKTGNQVRRYERMAAEFDGSLGGPLAKAVDSCMADLRKSWGMVDGNLPKPATAAKMVKPPRFTSGDYPAEALANDQKGITRYSLMLDEQGRLLDCVVNESSGIATLNTKGCQILS